MLGTDPLRYFHGLLKRIMRNMFAVFYAVDDEVVQSAELFELLFRDMVHVGAVCDVSETESQDRQLVMHSPYRNDLYGPDRFVMSCHRADITLSMFPGQDFIWSSGMDGKRLGINVMYMPFRSAGIFLLSEGIAIFHPEGILYILFTIYFRSFLFKIVEGTYIVKAARMVLMIVSEQDGIYM